MKTKKFNIFGVYMEIKSSDYKQWLIELKSRIRQSQIKAAIAVNTALIEFYWDLGKMIAEMSFRIFKGCLREI